MTRIKFCGLTRECDIEYANEVQPDYIGFVFAKKSQRYITPEAASCLRSMLSPDIKAVGVFVDEDISLVSGLLESGTIDMAQLHGDETEEYINVLRHLTGKPVIRAFKVKSAEDLKAAASSGADYLLLDAGAGDGMTFDWSLLEDMGDFKKPYFLAGGLDAENVAEALNRLHPFGVDVSSGIETEGVKDPEKIRAFAVAVRKGGIDKI